MVPQASRGAELGRFLKNVARGREVEGNPGREVIDVQTALQTRLDIGYGVRQSEGHLLNQCGARFPQVVPTHVHKVPAGQVLRAVLNQVYRQSQRRPGWKDIVPASQEFLEDIILRRAGNS